MALKSVPGSGGPVAGNESLEFWSKSVAANLARNYHIM